jgi:hypothetical protein
LRKWISIEDGYFGLVRRRKGYYMVKWTRVCRSKNKGGLGIKILENKTSVSFVNGGGSLINMMAYGRIVKQITCKINMCL